MALGRMKLMRPRAAKLCLNGSRSIGHGHGLVTHGRGRCFRFGADLGRIELVDSVRAVWRLFCKQPIAGE